MGQVKRDVFAEAASMVNILLRQKANRDNPPPEWEYLEPDVAFSDESWEKFLSTIGRGNYRLVWKFRHKDKVGYYNKATLSVNMAGMANLRTLGD